MASQSSDKRKAYLLILMVGIAALVAYFRFFREPEAAVYHAPESETVQPEARPDPVVETLSRRPGRVERRRARPPAADIARDIFAPAGPLPEAKASRPAPASRPPAVTLTLNGTIVDGQESLAIINNQFVKQGQIIDGYRVQKITADKVYLSSGQHRKVLVVMALNRAVQ